MPKITLDSAGTSVDIGTPNVGGDTLRAGVAKIKQWAADINSMMTELYVGAGDYKPGSLLSGLNLFDQLRWHIWFDDFVTGPALHTEDSPAGWAYIPGFPQWLAYGSTAGTQVVERNVASGLCTTGGSWLQLVTDVAATDNLHICPPDAAAPVPGATAVPINGPTKKYAVAMKLVLGASDAVYRVGFGAPIGDPNGDLTARTGAGIYLQTAAGVATIYIRNYEYISPKAANLPTTITYSTSTAYEIELLYDGAGSFSGQYRAFTGNTPGSWVSLGSVSLAGWQLEPGNMAIGPWMAVKNVSATSAELAVDYLLIAAER